MKQLNIDLGSVGGIYDKYLSGIWEVTEVINDTRVEAKKKVNDFYFTRIWDLEKESQNIKEVL